MIQRFKPTKIRDLVLTAMLAVRATSAIAVQDVSLSHSFDLASQKLQAKQLTGIENARLEATEARVQGAFSKFFPKIDASYSYQEQDDGNDGSESSKTAKISVTQNVFNGFKDVATKNSATHANAAQKLRSEFRQLLIKREVNKAYFSLAQAQAEMTVLDEVEATIKKRYKDILSRIRIGKSRSSEKTAVDAQIAVLAAQREKAIAAFAAAQTNFAWWTGLTDQLNLTDAKSTTRPEMPNSKLIFDSIVKRQDLLAMAEDVKSLEENQKAVRGDYLPSVNVFGDYYLQRSAPQDDVKWDFGVALTVPIFEGGITRAQAWEAAAKRQESSLTLRDYSLQAVNQLQTDYTNTRSLYLQAAQYEKAAAASSKTYKDLNREYNLGLANNLDVLQALNTYLDHVRALSETHAQYLMAYWDLRIMAGQEL